MQRIYLLTPLFVLVLLLTSCGNNEPSEEAKPKDECTTSADCAEGKTCEEVSGRKVCKKKKEEPSPCEGVSCSRGVCAKTTGACVNAAECDTSKECVDKYYCVNKVCVTADKLCEGGCKEGVCDPEKNSCVNASSCEEDQQCLKGHYCDATTKKCKKDKCDDKGIECRYGVCNRDTGECVSKAVCEKVRDCIVHWYCDSGTCKKQKDACKSCTGSQICKYDKKKTVTCKENSAGCVNKLDCTGDRICRFGGCQDASAACAPAAGEQEPNNDLEAATDLSKGEANVQAALDATLCGEDVDYYAYKVESKADEGFSLSVGVSVPDEDEGSGEVTVQLIGSDKTTVLEEKKLLKGEVTLVRPVTIAESGTYYIKVAGTKTAKAGIRTSVRVGAGNAELVQSCAAAVALQDGVPVQGDLRGETVSQAFKTTCGNSTKGLGAVPYVFTVEKKSLVALRLTNRRKANLQLSLRGRCLDDSSQLACGKDGTLEGEHQLVQTLEPGQYVALVQAATKADEGTYELSVVSEELICTPGETSCSSDNKKQITCNHRGVGYIEVECEKAKAGSTCDTTTKACTDDPLVGDSCDNPFILASNYLDVSGKLGQYAATYDPKTALNCSAAPGRDIVARVDARAGEIVYAILTYGGLQPGVSPVINILKNSCGDPVNTCKVGARALGGRNDVVYSYTVEESGVYYIIADASAVMDGDINWRLQVEVGAPSCKARTKACFGKNVEVCLPGGTGYVIDRTCGIACKKIDDTKAKCEPEANTVCDNALDITHVPVTKGYFEDYSNDIEPIATGCTEIESKGEDAIYSIKPDAIGDIFEISYQSNDSSSLLLLKSCSDLSTCQKVLRNDKIAVANREKKTFTWIAPSVDPVYLVVESDAPGLGGVFEIGVKKVAKVCEPGETKCNADGKQLEQCNSFGTAYVTTPCPVACTETGGVGTCDAPTGTTCGGAQPLAIDTTTIGVTNLSEVTLTASGQDHYHPSVGNDGECSILPSGDLKGQDHFYSVTIPAGYYLEVRYDVTSPDTQFILIDSCATDSCVEIIKIANQRGVFRYLNSNTTDLKGYLVVDSPKPLERSETNVVQLVSRVYKPDCNTPGKVLSCGDKGGQQVLKSCEESFEVLEKICYFGCEGSGATASCKAPLNNTCDDTGIVVPKTGETYTYNLNDYASSIDHKGASMCDSSLVAKSAPGKDAIFKIEGTKGDFVQVDLKSLGNPQADLALYAISDCKAAETTCLGGIDTVDVGTESMEVRIPEWGKVFVVVDSVKEGDFLNGVFEITFGAQRTPICEPSADYCDGLTARQCDERGAVSTEIKKCEHRCVEGVCKPPLNDTCDPSVTPLVNGAPPLLGNFAHYTNGVQFYNTQCALKNRSETTGYSFSGSYYKGNDAFYLIKEPAGNVVTVKVSPVTVGSVSAPALGLFLVSSCDPSDLTKLGCERAENKSRTTAKEQVYSFLMPNEPDGVWVMVDGYTGYSPSDVTKGKKGSFEISMTSQKPVCTPKTQTCDSANKVRTSCDDIGLPLLVETCTFGCDPTTPDKAVCIMGPNDTCSASNPVLVSGVAVSANFEDFTNKFHNRKNRCATFDGSSSPSESYGNDAFYRIDEAAGTNITLVLEGAQGTGTEAPDLALYVLSTCDASNMFGSVCLTGSESRMKGVRETLSFVMPASPVTVVVDAESSSSTATAGRKGSFTLTMVAKPPVCSSPNSYRCSGNDLVYCNDKGDEETVRTCPNGCNTPTTGDPACNQGTNNTCTSAQAVSADSSFFGNVEDYTRDFSIASNKKCKVGLDMIPTEGRDAVFNVSALATHTVGSTVTVTLTPSSSYVAQLYATKSCTALNTVGCLAVDGVYSPNGSQKGKKRTITFNVAQGETVSVIADAGYHGHTGTFGIEFSYSEYLCTADEKRCGAEGDIHVCDSSGLFETWESCGGAGCTANACNAPTNDTCAQALALSGTHGSVVADLRNTAFTNTFPDATDASATSTCVSSSSKPDKAAGADAFYTITGTPGHLVTINAYSDSKNYILYTFSDCASVDTTCLGTSRKSEYRKQLNNLIIPPSGVIYLSVDWTYAPSSRSVYKPVHIFYDIKPPLTCTPGSVCQGSDLHVCSPNLDFYDITTCVGGCNSTLSVPACNPVSLDTCSDIVSVPSVVSGSTYTGEIDSSNTNEMSYSSDNIGKDEIYKVDLLKGETLTATLVGTFDTVLWLVNTCGDPSSSVAKAYDRLKGQLETLTYTAPANGTYYIIVDAYFKSYMSSPAGQGTYTLTVDISKVVSECVSGEAACNAQGHLKVCRDGKYYVDYCSAGCDSTGTTHVCKPPTNSTCAHAIDLALTSGSSKTVFGDLLQYTNDTEASVNCHVKPQTGPDAVYSIDLLAGELLSLELDDSQIDKETSLYINDDCNTVVAGCLARTKRFSLPQLQFTAPKAGKYYIFVDSSSSPLKNGNFALSVSRGTTGKACTQSVTSCVPGATPAEMATLTSCSLLQTHTVTNLCSTDTCNTGATSCGAPSGDVCADPLPIKSGEVVFGTLETATRSFSPSSEQLPLACKNIGPDYVLYGGDRFWSIDVSAGKTLYVYFMSGSSYANLYLLGSACDPSSCKAATFQRNGAFASYTATSDETITILVDATQKTSSANYSFYAVVK